MHRPFGLPYWWFLQALLNFIGPNYFSIAKDSKSTQRLPTSIDCSIVWGTLYCHGYTTASPFFVSHFWESSTLVHIQDHKINTWAQIKAIQVKSALCIAGACKMFIGPWTSRLQNFTSPSLFLLARTFGPVVKVEDCGSHNVWKSHLSIKARAGDMCSSNMYVRWYNLQVAMMVLFYRHRWCISYQINSY